MHAHYLWQRQMLRPPPLRTWAEVEKALERADALAPGSAEVDLVRCEYLLSVNKGDEALGLLEKATGRSPRFASLWAVRARALSRLGRNDDALKVLDQADRAAGPQALFAIDRATLLLARGHGKDALAALKDALGRAPAEQRPALWKALGEYYASQSDLPSARDAYRQYARLEPNNPEPHILLLDLALAAGDDAAVGEEVAALKALGGPNRLYWRLARVQELLHARPGEKADPDAEAGRLAEADGLVREIETGEPRSPLGFLLEGRLCERRRETDRAVAAYEKAVDRNGGQLALAPLVALLAREGRDDDLKRLRQKVATLPVELERLATLQALKVGDKGRAERLAERLAAGNPEALDVQVWQAQVLKELGKPEQAEQALVRLTKKRPEEPAPWIQLMMLQVGQKRAKDAAETVEQLRKSAKADRPELLWAQCYRVVGDLPRAEECFREALKKWPDDLAVRSSAVTFCEQTGRQAEAEGMLRKIHGRDPGLAWVTRRLAVSLAGHRNDREAWDEALRLIGPEAKPDDTPDDRLTRASVYAFGPEPRHRREARKILEGLAAELPRAAAVHELLARVLLGLGEPGPARARREGRGRERHAGRHRPLRARPRSARRSSTPPRGSSTGSDRPTRKACRSSSCAPACSRPGARGGKRPA